MVMMSSATSSLPPIEKTPILVLRFTPKATRALIDLVVQQLQQGGLVVLEKEEVDCHDKQEGAKRSKVTALTITTTQEVLEEQAELAHFMKLDNKTQVMEYFTVAKRQRFFDSQNDATTKTAVVRDKFGLFHATDWLNLTWRLFNSITVLKAGAAGEKQNALSHLLKEEYNANYLLKDNISISDLTKSQRWAEHGERSDCLKHVLETYELVDLISPVHLPALRRDITHQVINLSSFYHFSPSSEAIQQIQEYYGWEIGFYFAWMGFLTKWLAFPGILGLAVYGMRMYRGDSIDEDEYTPFYGLVFFIWAILFLRFWEREEHRLAYQWGTFSLSAYERQKYFAKRADFHGYVRKSPVTGELETYFPDYRRRLRYLFSAAITVAMLATAFLVMIFSMNLQGYIRPHTNPQRWHDDNPHPFHFPPFAALAEEGNWFDMTSTWRGLLPAIMHTICILTLNSIYRVVAEMLTKYENHETESSHSNSLILKRFLFEAFDCYVALFYLAFYERDVSRLRGELVTVFQIDSFRRVLLECLVPVLLLWRKTGSVWLPRKDASAKLDVPPTLAEILKQQADLDPYEQFDDYMEICIQLGYTTLFASAYPLASLVSIMANWVEMRADAFKMAAICQRPVSYRSSGLGMWRTLFSSVIWMSALTNCLIAGFTSDQLMHYLPSFYERTEQDFSDMGHEKGWVLVFIIFGLERFMLVIGLLLYNLIPEVPEDLLDLLEKREFLRAQEAEQAKKESTTSKSDKKKQ